MQRAELESSGKRNLIVAAFAVLSLPLGFQQPVATMAVTADSAASASAPLLTKIDVKAAAVLPDPVQTSPTGTQPATSAKTSVSQARRIVVSIPDRRLAVVEHGRVKKLYRVAVGAQETPSPTGRFRIVNKVAQPGYWHNGRAVSPGPGNPVGSRWIGLDLAHYGIHGTNEPKSVGEAASHGCVRMGRRDLEELFAQVRVGDEVEIADAPIGAATEIAEEETGKAR